MFLSQQAPTEVILLLMQACTSIRDLLALVSTCRRMPEVWSAHAASALWAVWLREIPHFQHALLAVSCPLLEKCSVCNKD